MTLSRLFLIGLLTVCTAPNGVAGVAEAFAKAKYIHLLGPAGELKTALETANTVLQSSQDPVQIHAQLKNVKLAIEKLASVEKELPNDQGDREMLRAGSTAIGHMMTLVLALDKDAPGLNALVANVTNSKAAFYASWNGASPLALEKMKNKNFTRFQGHLDGFLSKGTAIVSANKSTRKIAKTVKIQDGETTAKVAATAKY